MWIYVFFLLYVFGTCGYTTVQFFCYTEATYKKTATQRLHSYTRKSGWFMGLTRCNPRKSRQTAGLLLIRRSQVRQRVDFTSFNAVKSSRMPHSRHKIVPSEGICRARQDFSIFCWFLSGFMVQYFLIWGALLHRFYCSLDASFFI